MKYRAKCTNCISQLLNITKYKDAFFCKDAFDRYIEVDSEEEADLIEEINKQKGNLTKLYERLIKLTQTDETL